MMTKRRFRPYRSSLITVEPEKSRSSDSVTVIRPRMVLTATGEYRRSLFGGPIIEQVSYSKLEAMQKRNCEIDEKRMKETMTPAQLADLAAFQRSISRGAPWLFGPPIRAEGNASDTSNQEKSKELRQRQHAAWTEQLPTLCDAYQEFRSKTISTSGSSKEVRSFKVRCVDMDSEPTKVFTVDSFASSALNKVLIQHGYIGCSPLYPKIAVSLSLLNFFSNMMRRDPSVSVPALAKTNCDSRNVPYTKNFRTQLGVALDVFNLIEREAQRRSDSPPSGDAATR
ncbi:hypothetical protein FRC12_019038 [Ceratobasidium sp. 428]|nr:hypothetical protein FRC12_019038 [Ceratobasidium sp. 428]